VNLLDGFTGTADYPDADRLERGFALEVDRPVLEYQDAFGDYVNGPGGELAVAAVACETALLTSD
jgi:hypothetical protein